MVRNSSLASVKSAASARYEIRRYYSYVTGIYCSLLCALYAQGAVWFVALCKVLKALIQGTVHRAILYIDNASNSRVSTAPVPVNCPALRGRYGGIEPYLAAGVLGKNNITCKVLATI